MCVWPHGAAHHFELSYCLKKKYSTFICFISETRVPRGGSEMGWRKAGAAGLKSSWFNGSGLAGELQALSQPSSQKFGRTNYPYCAVSSSTTLSFAFCHASAIHPWSRLLSTWPERFAVLRRGSGGDSPASHP